MSKTEIPDDIAALAKKIGRQFESEQDLVDFSRLLKKMTVEAALGAELDDHLGYTKHSVAGRGSGNSRNGSSTKTLKGDHGEVEIATPRDRNGTFEPQLVSKGQTRLTQMDDQILALYAKGMTTRKIVETFQEMYGAEVSPSLISKVTDAVIDRVIEWQNRPLDPLYPIVYLDCIVLKIRQDKRVVRKSMYLALGINLEGHKELLGLWLAETEGAKFWLLVLTELQNRGLQDVFIAAVDGLSGFPEAINTVYPLTKIQLCIVHMVRNSLKFVTWKDRKSVAADLKRIYRSLTVEEAEQELARFCEIWDERYPTIGLSWHRHWANLITLFEYPEDIRKVIYTTNAIESLNSVIRTAVEHRKVFPHDTAAMKVVYLAVEAAAKKWSMPVRDWKGALNRFMIEFPERMPETL
jgi:putative transposase